MSVQAGLGPSDVTPRRPIYLDKKVQRYLSTTAQVKGIELSDLVNDLLSRQIVVIVVRVESMIRW